MQNATNKRNATNALITHRMLAEWALLPTTFNSCGPGNTGSDYPCEILAESKKGGR